MSIIIIGDIHGTTYWKNIVKEHKKTDEDMVIFLGDYVDSYNIDPKDIYQNLIDLFNYRDTTPNVHMLVGNHDYHYMKHDKDRYSGYNYQYANKYYEIFMDNLNVMEIVVKLILDNDDVICSHAGVSNTFLKKNKISLEELGELWLNNPSAFGFNHDTLDVYGNHPSQSPLWIRPQALFSDSLEGYSQIIGHTKCKSISYYYTKSNNLIIGVDTNNNEGYIVI